VMAILSIANRITICRLEHDYDLDAARIQESQEIPR
jgi:hypothetical protein